MSNNMDDRVKVTQFYYIVMLCVTSMLATSFVWEGIRSPSSDGYIRYETYLSFFESESSCSKYSTIGPLVAKLLDAPVRKFLPHLELSFFPKHLELVLYVIFSALLLVISKCRTNALLVMFLIPL